MDICIPGIHGVLNTLSNQTNQTNCRMCGPTSVRKKMVTRTRIVGSVEPPQCEKMVTRIWVSHGLWNIVSNIQPILCYPLVKVNFRSREELVM
ncbi:hypothetical protein FKM82_011725 [Ascaphus truei]